MNKKRTRGVIEVLFRDLCRMDEEMLDAVDAAICEIAGERWVCERCHGNGALRDEGAYRMNCGGHPDHRNPPDYYDTECKMCNGSGIVEPDPIVKGNIVWDQEDTQ